MRIAAALLIAAVAFAGFTAAGILRLGVTGVTPPAIVLHRGGGLGSGGATRPARERLAVPRKVEFAPLAALQRHRDHGARP
jgi:hypothetical protein